MKKTNVLNILIDIITVIYWLVFGFIVLIMSAPIPKDWNEGQMVFVNFYMVMAMFVLYIPQIIILIIILYKKYKKTIINNELLKKILFSFVLPIFMIVGSNLIPASMSSFYNSNPNYYNFASSSNLDFFIRIIILIAIIILINKNKFIIFKK